MKRLFTGLLPAILVLSLLLAGCAAAPSTSSSPAGSPSYQESPSSPKAAAPAAPPAAGAAAQSATDRMVVRNAALRLMVSNVEETMGRVARLVGEMGGYLVSSETRENNGDTIGKAQLRVPAEKLDETVLRLKQMASRVLYESTTAKDVTEEYVDQDARLRSLRAQEQQYLKLLEGARSTDDVVKITQALGNVREQIERTEGRMVFLRRSSETALITLDLFTPAAARPVDAAGWSPMDTLYSASRGLVGVAILLASLGIWLIVFTPLWLPVVWLIRRRRGRPRQAPPAPPRSTPASGTA